MKRSSRSSRRQPKKLYQLQTASQQHETTSSPTGTNVGRLKAFHAPSATANSEDQQSLHKRLHKAGTGFWLIGVVMVGAFDGVLAAAGLAVCAFGVLLMTAAVLVVSSTYESA